MAYHRIGRALDHFSKLHWSLPIEAAGFETPSFSLMILQTQRQAFELADDQPLLPLSS